MAVVTPSLQLPPPPDRQRTTGVVSTLPTMGEPTETTASPPEPWTESPSGSLVEPGLAMLPRPVVYAIVNHGFDASRALATVSEEEGLTVVMEQDVADDDGLVYEFVGAWITIEQQTALDAVGITARLSALLADAGIACNVLAGFHHDHLVVPWVERHDAMQRLRAIQSGPERE